MLLPFTLSTCFPNSISILYHLPKIFQISIWNLGFRHIWYCYLQLIAVMILESSSLRLPRLFDMTRLSMILSLHSVWQEILAPNLNFSKEPNSFWGEVVFRDPIWGPMDVHSYHIGDYCKEFSGDISICDDNIPNEIMLILQLNSLIQNYMTF